MPRQKEQADLISTLSDYDARIRKLERQMTIARTAFSFVTTKQSTAASSATPEALATADSVTVTCVAPSIVEFYVQVTYENSAALQNSVVFLRDETATTNYQIISGLGAGPTTVAATPGSTGGGIPGGYLALFVNANGPRTFSLRYGATGGSTSSFSNRILVASAPTRRMVN